MIYLQGRGASANAVFLPCSPLSVAHKVTGTAEFTARKSLRQAELQTQEIFHKELEHAAPLCYNVCARSEGNLEHLHSPGSVSSILPKIKSGPAHRSTLQNQQSIHC